MSLISLSIALVIQVAPPPPVTFYDHALPSMQEETIAADCGPGGRWVVERTTGGTPPDIQVTFDGSPISAEDLERLKSLSPVLDFAQRVMIFCNPKSTLVEIGDKNTSIMFEHNVLRRITVDGRNLYTSVNVVF